MQVAVAMYLSNPAQGFGQQLELHLGKEHAFFKSDMPFQHSFQQTKIGFLLQASVKETFNLLVVVQRPLYHWMLIPQFRENPGFFHLKMRLQVFLPEKPDIGIETCNFYLPA